MGLLRKHTLVMDIRDRILDIFETEPGNRCSGEKLRKALGVSRAAVWKHIEGLREEGYLIEAAPAIGYRFAGKRDILSARSITRRLTTGMLGREVRFFKETTSTNAVAMSLAAEGAPEGTLVAADSQTSGKGRLGRQWASPEGRNLYFSIVLRPAIPPSKAYLVTVMSSVALTAVIRREFGVAAGIKWPNDLLVNGRKLAGVLTEMKAETDRVESVVLGVGINVNWRNEDMPGEIRTIATSLSDSAGREISRLDLLAWFLEEMERLYCGAQEMGFDASCLMEDWRGYSCTLGRAVRIRVFGKVLEGIAENVDDDGRLLVNTGKGIEVVSAGDLEIL